MALKNFPDISFLPDGFAPAYNPPLQLDQYINWLTLLK
jgi:hypothetical protein